jgi:hypothetical protein
LERVFNLWKVVLNIINSLETMRNYTNLSTKDIRISMFKDLYEVLKQHGL